MFLRKFKSKAKNMDNTGKKTILYVDDEKINLELFRMNFMKDFNVIVALSAKEGLEIIAQHQIDIIISDYKMPIISGLDFIKEVKKLYPQKTCIIISGFAESDILNSEEKTLVFDFVTKPWLKKNLMEIIEKALALY